MIWERAEAQLRTTNLTLAFCKPGRFTSVKVLLIAYF